MMDKKSKEEAEACALTASASIGATDLRRLSERLLGVVERRTTIPVLGCFLVKFGGGHITMTATDLDIEMTLEAPANTEGEAAFCVPAFPFAAFLNGARGLVNLIWTKDEKGGPKLALADQDMTATFVLHMPPEDFPVMLAEKVDSTRAVRFALSPDQVRRMFGQSRHCISTEETRYYLNGAYLTTKPGTGTLRAVATDGHRLALIDSEVPASFGNSGAIVPVKSVDLILAAARPGANEPLDFTVGDTRAAVTIPGGTLRTKLIDGTFPDYTRVVPEQSRNIAVHLTAAGLRRIGIAASAITSGHRSKAAILDLAAKRLRYRDCEGIDVDMPLSCEVAPGSSDRLGYNLGYLCAQSFKTPIFTLYASNKSDPAVIRSEDPQALWVLMPMRV